MRHKLLALALALPLLAVVAVSAQGMDEKSRVEVDVKQRQTTEQQVASCAGDELLFRLRTIHVPFWQEVSKQQAIGVVQESSRTLCVPRHKARQAAMLLRILDRDQFKNADPLKQPQGAQLLLSIGVELTPEDVKRERETEVEVKVEQPEHPSPFPRRKDLEDLERRRKGEQQLPQKPREGEPMHERERRVPMEEVTPQPTEEPSARREREADSFRRRVEADPRLQRLVKLRDRYRVVMKHLSEGQGGAADADELRSVRAGLEAEYESYDPKLQQQVKQSYTRLLRHIDSLIERIDDAVKRGVPFELNVQQMQGSNLPFDWQLEGELDFNSMLTDSAQLEAETHQLLLDVESELLAMDAQQAAEYMQTDAESAMPWLHLLSIIESEADAIAGMAALQAGPTANPPASLSARLRRLQAVYSYVLHRAQRGQATEVDVQRLEGVSKRLAQEFASLPASTQAKAKDAYEQLQRAISELQSIIGENVRVHWATASVEQLAQEMARECGIHPKAAASALADASAVNEQQQPMMDQQPSDSALELSTDLDLAADLEDWQAELETAQWGRRGAWRPRGRWPRPWFPGRRRYPWRRPYPFYSPYMDVDVIAVPADGYDGGYDEGYYGGEDPNVIIVTRAEEEWPTDAAAAVEAEYDRKPNDWQWQWGEGLLPLAPGPVMPQPQPKQQPVQPIRSARHGSLAVPSNRAEL